MARLSEYLFLFVCGLIGAAIGIGNDLLTSWLSPDYFVFGKEIDPGRGFLPNVIWLAAKAGFAAGAGGAAVLLFMNNPASGREPLGYRRLLALTRKPIASALVAAMIGGAATRWLAAPALMPVFVRLLGADRTSWLMTVWAIHFGLYLGLAGGSVWAALVIRRERLARKSEGPASAKEAGPC